MFAVKNIQAAFLLLFSVQLIVLISYSEAIVFSRCELARTLLKHKFPRSELANWVCLIEAESSRNTAVVGPPNSDGSRDYGLFQINSRFWCSGGPASEHNICGVSCKALTNDNISDDVKCAKNIYSQHGFDAWTGWKNKCRGKDLSIYLKGCRV